MYVIIALLPDMLCMHEQHMVTIVDHQEIQCLTCFPIPQGSSPAGGCLMSLTCDYRIMADNPRYSIGLNETQLGIVAPFWSGMIHL